MKFDSGKLALAAAITSGLYYAVSSALFAFMKDSFVKLVSRVHYMTNPEKIMTEFNFSIEGFIFGLITVFLVSYIIAYIFASLYNSFVDHERVDHERYEK